MTVYGWGPQPLFGGNPRALLGVGDSSDHLTPVALTGTPNYQIARNGNNINSGGSILLDDAGLVYWVGLNSTGMWGDGTTGSGNHVDPVQVPGLSNIVKVACGGGTGYALDNAGNLYGWGANQSGALPGYPVSTNQLSPVLIETNVVDVDAVLNTVSVLKADGSVQRSDTATGNPNGVWTSYAVTGSAAVKIISNPGTAIVRADGTLSFIGVNQNHVYSASLSATFFFSTWQASDFGSNIVDAFSGAQQMFVVKNDGSIWGMGVNSSGQLGIGNTTSPIGTPTQWTAPTGFTLSGYPLKSTVADAFVVLGTDGLAYTWGRSSEGEMGNGATTPASTTAAASANGLTGRTWVNCGFRQIWAGAPTAALGAAHRGWAAVVG